MIDDRPIDSGCMMCGRPGEPYPVREIKGDISIEEYIRQLETVTLCDSHHQWMRIQREMYPFRSK